MERWRDVGVSSSYARFRGKVDSLDKVEEQASGPPEGGPNKSLKAYNLSCVKRQTGENSDQ